MAEGSIVSSDALGPTEVSNPSEDVKRAQARPRRYKLEEREPTPFADAVRAAAPAFPFGGTTIAALGGDPPPSPQFEKDHPVLSGAYHGGTGAAALSLAGRGITAAAPFTGPAAPFVAGTGRLLSAAPIAQTLMGTGGGALGGVAREYGPRIGLSPGQTEAAAIAAEMLGPLGLQKMGRGAYEAALGSVTREVEQLLPVARKTYGFDIEPKQARSHQPISTAGRTREVAAQNQDRANLAASRATGFEAKELGDGWARTTFNTLGQRFDAIYSKENAFEIPAAQVQKLTQLLNDEMALGTSAGVAPVKNDIMAFLSGSTPGAPVSVTGDVLKRLRQDLGKVARKASDPADRYAAGEVIGEIDAGVASGRVVHLPSGQDVTSHVVSELEYLRPKYRALMTLDELRKAGGIDAKGNLSADRLGDYLRTHDHRYRRGESTNPLAELGKVGETFGIKGIFEKESEKPLISAIKKASPYLAAGGVDALAHYAGGGVFGTYGAVSGATIAGKKAASLARGPLGQKTQQRLAPAMREKAKVPLAAEGGALESGPLDGRQEN